MAAIRSGPRVSVILPVFNCERYLSEAIQSIREQSFDDFELLICDDQSDDQSVAIASRFARRDRRIAVLKRHHTGIVGALNDGVAQARGEFMARMDADDIAQPARLAKQVEFLDEHRDYVLIGTRVRMVDPEGEPICEFPGQLSHEDIDHAHMNLGWAIVHPTVMMRSHALREVGGYRQQFETLEDLDLFLRLAEIGRLANLPELLLDYRQHFKSICFMQNQRQSDIRESVYREAYRRRGLNLNRRSVEFRAPLRTVSHVSERWTCQALEAGHIGTARKHALRLLYRQPFDRQAWRLMYSAFRSRRLARDL